MYPLRMALFLFSLWRSFFLALILLSSLGCSRGNPQLTGASVSGTVKYQGKIVTGGMIRLIALRDENETATGRILGDGTFTIPNAPLGEVKVVVDTEMARFDPSTMVKNAPPSAITFPKGSPMKYVPIDRKYRDPAQTSVRLTIEKGEQKKDIEMP
jgi:hypothetical protein